MLFYSHLIGDVHVLDTELVDERMLSEMFVSGHRDIWHPTVKYNLNKRKERFAGISLESFAERVTFEPRKMVVFQQAEIGENVILENGNNVGQGIEWVTCGDLSV